VACNGGERGLRGEAGEAGGQHSLLTFFEDHLSSFCPLTGWLENCVFIARQVCNKEKAIL
jgi:hypothetical protein